MKNKIIGICIIIIICVSVLLILKYNSQDDIVDIKIDENFSEYSIYKNEELIYNDTTIDIFKEEFINLENGEYYLKVYNNNKFPINWYFLEIDHSNENTLTHVRSDNRVYSQIPDSYTVKIRLTNKDEILDLRNFKVNVCDGLYQTLTLDTNNSIISNVNEKVIKFNVSRVDNDIKIIVHKSSTILNFEITGNINNTPIYIFEEYKRNTDMETREFIYDISDLEQTNYSIVGDYTTDGFGELTFKEPYLKTDMIKGLNLDLENNGTIDFKTNLKFADIYLKYVSKECSVLYSLRKIAMNKNVTTLDFNELLKVNKNIKIDSKLSSFKYYYLRVFDDEKEKYNLRDEVPNDGIIKLYSNMSSVKVALELSKYENDKFKSSLYSPKINESNEFGQEMFINSLNVDYINGKKWFTKNLSDKSGSIYVYACDSSEEDTNIYDFGMEITKNCEIVQYNELKLQLDDFDFKLDSGKYTVKVWPLYDNLLYKSESYFSLNVDSEKNIYEFEYIPPEELNLQTVVNIKIIDEEGKNIDLSKSKYSIILKYDEKGKKIESQIQDNTLRITYDSSISSIDFALALDSENYGVYINKNIDLTKYKKNSNYEYIVYLKDLDKKYIKLDNWNQSNQLINYVYSPIDNEGLGQKNSTNFPLRGNINQEGLFYIYSNENSNNLCVFNVDNNIEIFKLEFSKKNRTFEIDMNSDKTHEFSLSINPDLNNYKFFMININNNNLNIFGEVPLEESFKVISNFDFINSKMELYENKDYIESNIIDSIPLGEDVRFAYDNIVKDFYVYNVYDSKLSIRPIYTDDNGHEFVIRKINNDGLVTDNDFSLNITNQIDLKIFDFSENSKTINFLLRDGIYKVLFKPSSKNIISTKESEFTLRITNGMYTQNRNPYKFKYIDKEQVIIETNEDENIKQITFILKDTNNSFDIKKIQFAMSYGKAYLKYDYANGMQINSPYEYIKNANIVDNKLIVEISNSNISNDLNYHISYDGLFAGYFIEDKIKISELKYNDDIRVNIHKSNLMEVKMQVAGMFTKSIDASLIIFNDETLLNINDDFKVHSTLKVKKDYEKILYTNCKNLSFDVNFINRDVYYFISINDITLSNGAKVNLEPYTYKDEIIYNEVNIDLELTGFNDLLIVRNSDNIKYENWTKLPSEKTFYFAYNSNDYESIYYLSKEKDSIENNSFGGINLEHKSTFGDNMSFGEIDTYITAYDRYLNIYLNGRISGPCMYRGDNTLFDINFSVYGNGTTFFSERISLCNPKFNVNLPDGEYTVCAEPANNNGIIFLRTVYILTVLNGEYSFRVLCVD